jgi:hypothetical protein
MASSISANTKIQISNPQEEEDSLTLYAFSSTAGISSIADGTGMPQMGQNATSFHFTVDACDTDMTPFAVVQQLFNLCFLPDSTKFRTFKMTFWGDDNPSLENRLVILTLTFEGWVSSWNLSSGGGIAHALAFTLEPKLLGSQAMKITLGN